MGGLINENLIIYQGHFWPFFPIPLVPQIPILFTIWTPYAIDVLLNLFGTTLIMLAFGATVRAVIQQQL
ncbi:MAG: hypothetical protein QGI09_03110 [Dehalococcoidia bacterium]|nr:hypothetical protein [Dehalococcoidia bacterium]